MALQVSDNLWIGDLPEGIDDATLRQTFEGYGTVLSSKVIPPKAPGRNAAALVRFSSVEDAKWVVENLNGNMPEGFTTPVLVQYAKNPPGAASYGKDPSGGKGGKGVVRAAPYSDWNSWGDGGSFGKGGKAVSSSNFKGYLAGLAKGGSLPGVGARPDENCVHVKNLPPDTTDLQLYQVFSLFGAIAYPGVTAMMNEDGTCKGIGFVDFQDPAAAALAVQVINGSTMPDGTTIMCNIKRSRGDAKGKGGGKGFGEFGYDAEAAPFY